MDLKNSIIEYIKKKVQVFDNSYIQFVLQNSILFYNIGCAEIKKIPRLNTFKCIDNYSKIELNDSFDIAQQFFYMHNIKIDLKELYEKKILRFCKFDEPSGAASEIYAPRSQQGYIPEIGAVIQIFPSYIFLDSFAIIHEVSHYMNQPKGKRNMVSDMMTETISYSMEFIFAQSLIENNFHIDDAKIFIYNCYKEAVEYAYVLNPIYRILYTFITFKDINKNKYCDLIPNGNYENDIKEFEKYINEDRDYIIDTWNFLGKSLAIYFYGEYLKNHYAINKLLILNDSINKMPIDSCLKIIDINTPEEMFNKMQDALDFTIDYLLNNINNLNVSS